MLRPDLASAPFLDARPVVITGVALGVLALALSALSIADFVSERGEETQLAQSVRDLEGRRARLSAEVTELDQALARTPWKKLRAETASMQQLVVQRRSIWGPLLADLERVLPWDTRLSSINPQVNEDGEIVVALSGIAVDRVAWLKLLGRLFTDRHFSEPVPRSEQAPGDQNAAGYRFVLQVKYWPEGRR